MEEPTIKKKRTGIKKSVEDKNIEKFERKALQEKQKLIRPKECIKYIKIFIDPICLNNPHGTLVLSHLADFKVAYEIKTHSIPGIIYWNRQLQQTISSSVELKLTERYEESKDILLFITGEEIINLINHNELNTKIKVVKEIYPNKFITLIVYGLREYCRINRNLVRRREIELNLTELQIFGSCNHRLIETSAEFAMLISQFSKSIAELPYKKQLSEKYNQEDFYIMNDNRDCVSVQNSIGLSRLWQQHLIKFPLVTLETAEAIIKEYPMPKNLIEAYENCGKDDGINLLSNIQVRRAGGPLKSVRKIGPELSRKIYMFYTTTDPNEIIG